MIIFISGTINSGKSTVAKIISERLSRCANVEPDELRNFIRWMDIDEAVPITIENTIDIVKNFSEAGYDVVVPYPIDEITHAKLEKSLAKIAELHFFTLNPDIVKCKTNTPERVLTDWEIGRIELHHKNGLTKPDFGIVIDSTKQTPEKTANQILAAVGASKA